MCGKVRHHSVSLQRESRHATRISARGANLGHVGRISDISDVLATAKFEMCIYFFCESSLFWGHNQRTTVCVVTQAL